MNIQFRFCLTGSKPGVKKLAVRQDLVHPLPAR